MCLLSFSNFDNFNIVCPFSKKNSFVLFSTNLEKDKKFRIRSKSFFLTWPQVPDVDNLLGNCYEQIKAMFKIKSDTFWSYFIVIEHQKNDDKRVHAWLVFKGTKDVSDINALHLTGKVGNKFHVYKGNYQAGRNKSEILKYLLKTVALKHRPEDKPCCSTNMKIPAINGIYFDDDLEHLYYVLRKDGFAAPLKALYKLYPLVALSNDQKIKQNLEQKTRVLSDSKAVRGLGSFNIPAPVQFWLNCLTSSKTLALIGESGVGKTEFAKALCTANNWPYLVISDIEELLNLEKKEYQAIIFDDVAFHKIDRDLLLPLIDTANSNQICTLDGLAHLHRDYKRIITASSLESRINYYNYLNHRLHIVDIKVSEPLMKLEDTNVTI